MSVHIRAGGGTPESQEEFKIFSNQYPNLAVELDYLRKNQVILLKATNQLTLALKGLASKEDVDKASKLKETLIFVKQAEVNPTRWRDPAKLNKWFDEHKKH